ncbi:hypothetical protein [Proteus mirabilis]
MWQFVDGKPIDNQWQTISQVPAFTEIFTLSFHR